MKFLRLFEILSGSFPLNKGELPARCRRMAMCARTSSWMPRWILLATALFIFGCADGTAPTGAPGVGVEVGSLSPDFQAKNLRGGTSTLFEHRGKVVLVNFWATWCGPCKAEMPSMEALYREYQKQGLEILAISIDTTGAPQVRAYIEEFGFTFPVLMDSEFRVNDLYRVRVVPTSILIDRDGKIAQRLLGSRDWNDPDYRKLIEERLHSDIAKRERLKD